MRVCVALEERFERTPDGQVWTAMPVAYPFWRRYLDAFDHVQVVARVRPVSAPAPEAQRADGAGVTFAGLPYYVGPWQYLRVAPQVHRAIVAALGPDDAAILRVGSNVGNWLAGRLHQLGRPYGVEVVQDPFDAYAPGACRTRLRPLFRWLLTQRLKEQCQRACAAAYVTEAALQRRYPCAPGALSTHFSSVELPATVIAPAPRTPQPGQTSFTLGCVGMMHQLYKAQDVLIDAVAHCVGAGLDVRLILVGDGQHRAALEAYAAARGLQQRVQFVGQVTAGATVRNMLDTFDLFVLPSRQEGLPRAMIEAMARGLPCLGSTVGGFPELLDATDLVTPGNVDALAAAIRNVLASPERMSAMAARNLAHADRYRDELLHERRRQFYAYVRQQTEAYIRTCGGRCQ
jgi:glycosyltransferase involved in cell wall biosynthesis